MGPQLGGVAAGGDLVAGLGGGVVVEGDATGCAGVGEVLDLAVDGAGRLGVGGGDRDGSAGLDVAGMCLGHR